jgi:Putative peptidoglycan binding domain
MSEDRVARGCRVRGYRWLCACLLGAIAAACVGVGGAVAATGGSGLGTKPHKHHQQASGAQANPLAERGMWIWYVSRANGGNVNSIIGTVRRRGIGTVMIKSGDGSGYWSQFSSGLVSALHAAGIHVCAWQYVYGTTPTAEAQVGAQAVHNGADCLLIDAESEYEGKYVSAQTYIRELRRLVGSDFPIGLASFPYVDYHPALPYSVFLGPNGAQYNVPQMYWSDIGTTVDDVYSHTYVYNRPYDRPIEPLGDVTTNPPGAQIRRFRQLSRSYAADGVSWWEWSQTPQAAWHALSQPVGSLAGYRVVLGMPSLARGASGDLVVWAQEHLYSAGQHITIDGAYGPHTQGAVRRFQSAHGLTSDGVIGLSTWEALLKYQAVNVTWTSKGAHVAVARNSIAMVVPKSARLRAKRYEIPRGLGRG